MTEDTAGAFQIESEFQPPTRGAEARSTSLLKRVFTPCSLMALASGGLLFDLTVTSSKSL